jgi:hypothetical protein
MCIPWIYLSNELLCAPNGDRMQKLRPWEVDVSTTRMGARKPFDISSSVVRVLDFIYVKMSLEPQCKHHHLLVNERSHHIYSQR